MSLNTPPQIATSSFIYFPLLPPELKLKVWSAALLSTPYHHPQTHHITAHLYTYKRLRQSRCFPSDHPKYYTDLPLGFEELCPKFQNTKDFRKDMTVFTSPRPMHPLLFACHDSRKLALGECKGLEYAFGTYVNFEKDTLFLDIGDDIKDIFPLIARLPRKFEGLAVRTEVARAIERKREDGIWRTLGKLIKVHEASVAHEEIDTIKDMVLVDYAEFHGRDAHTWMPAWVSWVEKHVVAIDRKWLDRVAGMEKVQGGFLKGMEYLIWRWMMDHKDKGMRMMMLTRIIGA